MNATEHNRFSLARMVLGAGRRAKSKLLSTINMKTHFVLAGIVGILAVSGLLSPALADHTWLEAESTCSGDGWFHYRVGSREWAIISSFTFTGVEILSTNWVEIGSMPSGWSATNDDDICWSYTSSAPAQPVPYDATFAARSSLTNHQQGTGIMLMSLMLYETPAVNGGVYSANIVGYWMFPALVPCLPEEADGSPSSLYTNMTYQDITITDLVRDSGKVKGLTFVNQYDVATYLLEATSDLTNWLKVAYIDASPGTFTWTTNTDLGQWGNFYRLEYIGYGFIDPARLPPLNQPASPSQAKSALGPPPKAAPLPQVSFVNHGKLDVGLDTVPGQSYEVEVRSAGKTVWSTRCSAAQTHTVVSITAADLPPSGMIVTRVIP